MVLALPISARGQRAVSETCATHHYRGLSDNEPVTNLKNQLRDGGMPHTSVTVLLNALSQKGVHIRVTESTKIGCQDLRLSEVQTAQRALSQDLMLSELRASREAAQGSVGRPRTNQSNSGTETAQGSIGRSKPIRCVQVSGVRVYKETST